MMFKVDKIRNVFDCDLCSQLLVDPITLVCGYSICKRHTTQFVTKPSYEGPVFKCDMCLDEHCVPKKGFSINKRIQNGLEIQFDTLKLTPAFDECKKEIEEAKRTLLKMELFENDTDSYIYGYFEELKRQVDLRREELKLSIDTYSDEMIHSLEADRASYIKISKGPNRIKINIDKSKRVLNEIVGQFDTLDFNEKKFEDIKKDVAALNDKFQETLKEFKVRLVGNQKHRFRFVEMPIVDVFGKLDVEQVIFVKPFW